MLHIKQNSHFYTVSLACKASVMLQGCEVHCKNIWVTSTHNFRLSQLHHCEQGMLSNRFSWKFIEELLISYISYSLFQKTYLATFLALLPQPYNQGTPPGADHCVRSKPQLIVEVCCFFDLPSFYRLSERKFSAHWKEILISQKREASQLYTLWF